MQLKFYDFSNLKFTTMDKTQKRQLETNDLSEKVLSFFDKIQPYLIPILLAALLLTVFYLSFTLYNSWNTGKTAKVCEKIFQNVNNPAELEEYAQQVNQPLKSWALNLAGNARLSEAITNVPNNRAAAEEALAKAEEDFNTASNSPNDDAQQLACFGLARVYEQKAATTATDSAKNIANSIKYYKSLTTKWPSSIYAKQAQMRIAALSNETTVKILSDYATYEKTEPPAGERNDIPLDINAPAEEQPAATEEAKPAEEQPTATEEAKPAEVQPAAEEAKPAEEQPAPAEEAKPAEEKPAPTEEAKPAEEKPAPAEEAK